MRKVQQETLSRNNFKTARGVSPCWIPLKPLNLTKTYIISTPTGAYFYIKGKSFLVPTPTSYPPIFEEKRKNMPKKEPTVSYTLLRNYTEQFQWKDSRTGLVRKGFNPPKEGVTDVERVPFFIRYITTTGKVESGSVVCISVQPERAQRKIKFVQSGEIRIVNDHLIIEVDGTKFLTH